MTAKEAIVILEKQFDKSCAGYYQDTTKLDFEDALYMAITALHKQAEAENKPLTLDELRKMDGEPVWIVFTPNADEESLAMWALVSANDEEREVFLLNNTGGSAAYEEVWADIKAIYRYKPMEGTT